MNNIPLLEVKDFLCCVPLLQQLPKDVILKIASVLRPMNFGAEELLVDEGEGGREVYFVWDGQAEISTPFGELDTSALASSGNALQRGDYFGYSSSNSFKGLQRATVVAKTEVICLILPHEHASLLSTNSLWTQNILTHVATVERILDLDKVEVDLFKGYTLPEVSIGRVFGGQFVGQALAAASKSVNPSLLVHSLHSYFIRVGDESIPIIYQVQRVRDSHRSAVRHVVAHQKGRSIFLLTASFEGERDEAYSHQEKMPDAPNPEELVSSEEIEKAYAVDPQIPATIRKQLIESPLKKYPLDIRLCDRIDLVNPVNAQASQRVWLRAKEKLSDDQALHRCVVAFASDWMFLQTVLRPYQKCRTNRFTLLSLDHSLWFHKPLKADEWLLFTMRSPCATGARGFVYGHMYNQRGELVVSATQEGLMQRSNGVINRSNL